MANVFDKRPIGERETAVRQGDSPTELSTLDPIPAYPNLKRILRSWTATMILTYLEIHHPAQQDASGRFVEPPMTLSLDQLSQDLQVGRRTLFTALCVLCSRYRNEELRGRAARAAREFFNTAHTTNGKIKHYSYVGPSSHRPGTTFTLRRNHRLIERTLQQAKLTRQALISPTSPLKLLNPLPITIPTRAPNTIDHTADHTEAHPISDRSNSQLLENSHVSHPVSTVHIQTQNRALIDTLLSGSVLSVDRRSVRYPRLRAAVEAGLEGPEALKVAWNERSARKRGFIPDAQK